MELGFPGVGVSIAGDRQCILVLMGATADGHKALIAVAVGSRFSSLLVLRSFTISRRVERLWHKPRYIAGRCPKNSLDRKHAAIYVRFD